jgi:hypothetical protein
VVKLFVGNELHFISCEEEFVHLVERYLGYEAGDLLKEYLTNHGCDGECDYTYELQEDYENGIDEALEILEEINDKRVQRACHILKGLLS